MTQLAVEGYRAEREAMLGVLRSLQDDEWEQPTGCEGWSVKDLTLHLGTSLQIVVDPEKATPPGDDGTEAALDSAVAAARDLSPSDALAMYEKYSEQACDAFAGLQAEGVAGTEIPMADLGTHPLHYVANAFAFDTYTHLRLDLLPPRGSIERDVPPPGDAALQASVEWLLAGLPQMCTAALKPVMTDPVHLVLAGPAGGEWTIEPSESEHACEVTSGTQSYGAARIESTVEDFVRWSTKRADWRDYATVSGDHELAEPILDAINLI